MANPQGAHQSHSCIAVRSFGGEEPGFNWRLCDGSGLCGRFKQTAGRYSANSYHAKIARHCVVRRRPTQNPRPRSADEIDSPRDCLIAGRRRLESDARLRAAAVSGAQGQHQKRATKNPARAFEPRGVFVKKSGDTYSRTFGTTIGSESLTTVFGMGTGVTFQIWSPEKSSPAAVKAARRLDLVVAIVADRARRLVNDRA